MSAEDEKDQDDKEAAAEEAPAPAASAPKKKRKKRAPVETAAAEEDRAEEAPAPAPREEAEPPASRRKAMIALLVVAAAAIGIGGYLVSRDSGKPAWKTGEEVNVEITIVGGDATNLACAAGDEVAGRHCAFEAADKPWSKSKEQDDTHTLKPYTTMDKRQLAAAGLWSQPALQGKLPTGRFTVACKLKVEGQLTKPLVRWSATGPFIEAGPAWPAGLLSDCKIAGETAPAGSASAK